MFYIYKYTHKINNKIYIGKTNNINRRKNEHLSKSKKIGNNHFNNAIKKYGMESFNLETIYECENEENAYKMEMHFISLYKSNNKQFGYNSTVGGEGLCGASEETKNKISEAAKSKIGDKNSFFGKKHTNESKEKISRANKGKLAGENHPLFGTQRTEETKKKIARANKGRHASRDTEFKPGQVSANRKLIIDQAREIRIKRQNGISVRNLQKEYVVSRDTIYAIINNETYKE
jgi:group I intron endonuclease